jgi:copper transport protein
MYRLSVILLVSFLFLWVVPSTSPVEAHGYLVRSIPENRAVYERPPNRLQYWFSEALEPNFSKVNLRNQAGDVIATGGLSENDDRLLTLDVPELEDGAYIVELRPAFASDGHVVAESRIFFVGEEIGGIAGQGLTDQAIPLEVLSRFISMASSILLFGALALYSGVLVPAWGSPKYPAGNLPPRLMRQLNWVFGLALIGALAGNIMAMIQQTMAFFNVSFINALKPEFWQLVRVGSRFGDIWNWRMLFLVIAGVLFGLSIYQRNSQPRSVRAYWTANLWLVALVLGSHSILSHAAGSLLWPWMAVLTNWLHILAVGFWAGALVVLIIVLPTALQPYADETRRHALLAVLNKFSPIAGMSLAVVVVTGIYSATNWIFTPSDVQSTFGGALIFKLILVLALVALGALHFIALNPARFARFETFTQRISGFMPTLRLEAIFAVLVLGSASLLSATPIPQPEFVQGEVKTPTQEQKADDLTIEMTLIPGGLGVNTFDVYVAQNRGHLQVDDINVINVFPASAYRSERHTLEDVDFGVFATATDDIQMTGKWWSLIDITLSGKATVRYAFEWDIDGTAGVIQSIEPTLINWLALGLVVVVLGWIATPFMKHWFGKLNLDVASSSIAIATIAMTIIAMVGGYIYIQEIRGSYADKINQPALAVNEVLPDQASLDRGRMLYGVHCIVWQIYSRDFNVLRDRLDTIRDDELYLAMMDGWRGLPQCGKQMTVSERWDVVNYLRIMPYQRSVFHH